MTDLRNLNEFISSLISNNDYDQTISLLKSIREAVAIILRHYNDIGQYLRFMISDNQFTSILIFKNDYNQTISPLKSIREAVAIILRHNKDIGQYLRFLISDFEPHTTIKRVFKVIYFDHPKLCSVLIKSWKEMKIKEIENPQLEEYFRSILCNKYLKPKTSIIDILRVCVNDRQLFLNAFAAYEKKLYDFDVLKDYVMLEGIIYSDSDSESEENFSPFEKENIEYENYLLFAELPDISVMDEIIDLDSEENSSDSDSFLYNHPESYSEYDSEYDIEYDIEYDAEYDTEYDYYPEFLETFELESEFDSATILQNLPIILVDFDRLSKHNVCTICLQNFNLKESARLLPCKHYYHEACIMPWIEKRNSCPCCRKKVYCKSESL